MVEVITSREVPLGGPRGMTVHRTLPHRDRSFIGAWCFVDHYGPDPVGDGAPGMDVAPHPHTGLQTVSWLFDGHIEHRDSGGVHALVHPAELNLMTGGVGICHSEVSTPDTEVLHGVQLWLALPDHRRHAARDFQHHAPAACEASPGVTVRVFLGELGGIDSSPVDVHTPLVGAQLDLAPGAAWTMPLHPHFEHGILLDRGGLTVDGTDVGHRELAYLDTGATGTQLHAGPDGARAILLGGEPFEEPIVMWWNFVGRTHEEIVEFREAWESGSAQFGEVEGYRGETQRIPAPAMPATRLKPRRRVREKPMAATEPMCEPSTEYTCDQY